MSSLATKSILVLAGLLGALGVMAAAMASHSGEARNVGAIATIALAHAPVLLMLGLVRKGRMFDAAGAVLAFGTSLFVLDLGMRELWGHAFFPGAAPIGGGAMILGWLLIAAAGALYASKASG